MARRRRKKRVLATLPMKNSDFLVQKMVHPEIEVHPEICLHVSFFKIFGQRTSLYNTCALIRYKYY